MPKRRIQTREFAPWDPDCFQSNPLLADLETVFQPRRWYDWPDVEVLSTALADRVAGNPAEVPRFVAQPAGDAIPAVTYERQVTERGEVRTRERNWHDLFNAFAWWLFPRTRRWLSAAHFDEVLDLESGQRTARRDALTLFDECGVVLLCTPGTSLPTLHAAHRWDDMFVAHRPLWGDKVAAMILGHGLYEQCLSPYIGLTGKALWLTVDSTVFDLPLAQRYAAADSALAARLARGDELRTPRALLPLPILGVPGWWPDNCRAGFYANTAYFRPRPQRKNKLLAE